MSKYYRHAIVVAVVLIVFPGLIALGKYTGGSAERAEPERVAAIEAEEIAKVDMGRERNFRDTYWGMTQPQVEASEKWDHLGSLDDSSIYEGEIFNTKCRLYYLFRKGDKKLEWASYTFSNISEKDAYALRVLIETVMTKKYGHYYNESKTRTTTNTRSEYKKEWIADEETTITLCYTFPEMAGDSNHFRLTVSYANDSKEKKARAAARFYEKGASNF